MGDRGRIVSVGGGADTVEKGVIQIAEQGVALSEYQTVAADCPDERHHRHHVETLHHGTEDIATPDESAIKECQARAGHHEHQG